MGTSEKAISRPQSDDEIISKAQSNGPLENTHDDGDRGEPEALAQQLEMVKLKVGPKEIAANDDDDNNGYGDGAEDEKSCTYPLRPDAADCPFYLKTGNCKFGLNCRFNHPPRQGNQVAGYMENEVQESSEPVGKTECKYYRTPGGCKYGDSCKYTHVKASPVKEPIELNFIGLPIRLGEKDCPFYMRKGACGYGLNCRFHHPDPDPAEANESGPDNSLVNGQSVRGIQYPETYETKFAPLQSPGVPHSPVASLSNYADAGHCLSYVPAMASYPQGMPQNPGWNQHQATFSMPQSSQNFQSNGAVTNPLKKAEFTPHHQQQSHVDEFPERPGLPECDYFMKTGNCRYKSICRYHHPRSRIMKLAIDARNNFSKGANSFAQHHHQPEHSDEFPERPGYPDCEYFMKTGDCKFKSSCRYHHPRSRNPNSVTSALHVNVMPSGHAPNPTPEPSLMVDKSANSSKEKGFRNRQKLQQAEEFPERPGEPECEYYMKTGSCKYKSVCRFDHPKNRSSTLSACAISAKGLPLRPGSKICRHYEQHGTCRYGQRCLFDHPDDNNSSAYPAAASASASASETPASYPDALAPESTAYVPATGSPPSGNEYGSNGWGDGWVL